MKIIPSVYAALLASVAAFRPFDLDTNAGSILYIHATGSVPTALATPPANAIAWEALSWVRVSQVGEVGEMGVQENMLSYDTWDTDVVQKQKGMKNAGDPTVEVARSSTDAGQLALRAAAKTKLRYGFKIERANAPEVGGTGLTFYNYGLVAGPTRPMGRNEDFDLEVFTLGLTALETVVEPAEAD